MRSFLVVSLACCALVSCTDGSPQGGDREGATTAMVHHDFGQPLGMTRAAYASFLQEQATLIAESEMARLSAIEMIYRNKTYRYTFESNMVDLSPKIYTKLYRQFTGFEVVDITLADSVIRPVEIDIAFQFEVVTSKIVGESDDPESVKIAKNNYDFRPLASDSAQLTYVCDENGALLESGVEGLGRPNFYEYKPVGTGRMTQELLEP